MGKFFVMLFQDEGVSSSSSDESSEDEDVSKQKSKPSVCLDIDLLDMSCNARKLVFTVS